MTLLVVALSLLGWAGFPLVWLLAVLIPPLHLYRQLREAYRLQKSGLLQTMEAKKLRAVVFFMYTDKSHTSFAVLYKAMTASLQQLQQKALAHEDCI